ncbi:MAG: EamA family transporter [Candidatus Heimdallarchaeota archaeon]|nr:EamA family transporter [Candidatus Heimdallarchaeota archaeon]
MVTEHPKLILGLGVLAVTSSVFIILYADQDPYTIAFVRVFLTGLISYVILGRNHPNYEITPKDYFKIFIAGLSLATHFGWWFTSINYIDPGISLALTNTAPVWLAIISYFLLKLPISRNQVISILLVLLGSSIAFFNEDVRSAEFKGLTLALGSAIGFAIYLMIARDQVAKIGLWKYFGLVNLSSAVTLFFWLLMSSNTGSLKTPEVWVFGLLLALIPGLSGHAVYNWAMAKFEAVEVGIATLGEPILGAIIAWVAISGSFDLVEFTSVFILVLAITLVVISNPANIPSKTIKEFDGSTS